jgi:hypothetical protein
LIALVQRVEELEHQLRALQAANQQAEKPVPLP